MLRIGICDDSAEARLSLHAMLERLLEKRAVESQIYEFSSGEGLLGWMEKHTGEVDLVFLDIEMGGMNGMETAKALRAQSDTLQLVFVTGYTDFVFDGYSVGASFVRIHQRYLVRAGAVDRVEGGTVVIGADKLPVSRSYQSTALAAIARAMLE